MNKKFTLWISYLITAIHTTEGCRLFCLEYHQLGYKLNKNLGILNNNEISIIPVKIRSSRKKKWDTVLQINLTYGTLFILMLRGSEKKIQMGGQTTMAKNSRTSFRLFPVQLSPPLHNSLRYDWTCKCKFNRRLEYFIKILYSSIGDNSFLITLN